MVGVAVPMTDIDGDNVWDFTISIPSGSYEYKFSRIIGVFKKICQ